MVNFRQTKATRVAMECGRAKDHMPRPGNRVEGIAGHGAALLGA